jgi:hypothetical protein
MSLHSAGEITRFAYISLHDRIRPQPRRSLDATWWGESRR